MSGVHASTRACIIGAGSSGIAAAQVLAERGIEFDCYEMGSGVGGNWRYDNDNGVSSAYRSLHINTSRDAMEYAAYPMPPSLPDYPSHWQIADYFDDYVDHFGLREKVTFRTEVVKVAPAGRGGYDVTVRPFGPSGRGSEATTRHYDHVLVANGHHWDPRWPEPGFPGSETFPGDQVHAHYYRTPDLLEDRRVVVLGIGNSAADIAVESSRVAAETYLAMRRGAHVVPKYVFGRPTDHLTDSPLARAHHLLQKQAMKALLRLTVGKVTDYGLPEPDHDVLEAHPTVSDDLLTRLGHGDITVKPNIDRFEGPKVFFTDGSAVEADVVVYCTGYKVSFPFLDESVLAADENHVDLYRRVVPPDRPGLWFIGLVQPLGAVMPLAEAQAHWVADLISRRGHAALGRGDARPDHGVRRRAAQALRRVQAAHHPGRRPQVPRRDPAGAGVAPRLNGGESHRLTNKKSGLTVCCPPGHDGRVSNAVAAGRVPQGERTRLMRARLLEATVDCLVEHGFSGTSTTLVSERAGVSRGAQLHHFPTKNDLVVAAVEHLTDVRGAELVAASAKLPTGPRRTRAVLQMLADHFTSPVFTAALELWVAARTDEHLLAAVEPAGAAGGPRDPPDDRRAARRRRVPPRRTRARAGHPRPGPRPGPGQHHLRRRPAPEADPGPLGDHPRRRPGGEPVTSLLDDLLADLKAEGDQLWSEVSGLDEAGWSTPTPAEGWDVATQVAHLLWTDEVAVVAATDKEAWDEIVLQAIADPHGFVDAAAVQVARMAPAALLARWGAARQALTEALRAYPDGQKMPWFGPPMSPASMVTARFMETWAHALDVYDALGVSHPDTDRIRHIAHLGVRTRNFAFATNELEPPGEEFRVELVAPSGDIWSWGPAEAGQRVSGPAGDFCRLVTQRVHREDTDLKATGPDAEQWLAIAQCFAGPPGEGRAAT